MGELPDHTDVLIIGGGPGGYAAAFRAAILGLDVTIVSDDPTLGGVCLLRGCIPSKALLDTVEVMTRTAELADRGIAYEAPQIDLAELRDHTSAVVRKLTDGLGTIAEHYGLRIVHGRATFEGSRQVHISDGEESATITFDRVIVAVGSTPTTIPGIDFGGLIMDSTAALELAEIPDRLLVVGGGYVGLELGTVYAGLGSNVTVVEMADRLLSLADTDLVEPLQQQLATRFEAIHFGTTVKELRDADGRVEAVFEGADAPEDTYFDRTLIAIGRRPNTAGLGLESTAVDTDDRGFIVVDETGRTSERRIFAIGDVTGGFLLAHEAMREGEVAAEAIAGNSTVYDVRAMPAVVYTDPQIAWCGLTEQQAAAEERDVQVTRFPWRASGRAMTMDAGNGMTKLITDPDSQLVLGVGIVGRGAESLIAEGALAIEMGAVAADIDLTVHPHPTLSEATREAAARLLGHPTHIAARPQRPTDTHEGDR